MQMRCLRHSSAILKKSTNHFYLVDRSLELNLWLRIVLLLLLLEHFGLLVQLAWLLQHYVWF